MNPLLVFGQMEWVWNNAERDEEYGRGTGWQPLPVIVPQDEKVLGSGLLQQHGSVSIPDLLQQQPQTEISAIFVGEDGNRMEHAYPDTSNSNANSVIKAIRRAYCCMVVA